MWAVGALAESLELDAFLMESAIQEFTLRQPTLDDASWIWRLVRETGVLDENSSYAYLLLCKDFANTCLVAERGSQLVGFVTGYRPPQQSTVLFVWQVGVSSIVRRRGLAIQMLAELVNRCRRCEPSLEYVEATVAPSNTASRELFDALARHLEAPLTETEGFDESHFRFGSHESEPLIRIGPLPSLPHNS